LVVWYFAVHLLLAGHFKNDKRNNVDNYEVSNFSFLLAVDAVAHGRPSGEQFISSVCQQYIAVSDSADSGSWLHGLRCHYLEFPHHFHRTSCVAVVVFVLTGRVAWGETEVQLAVMVILKIATMISGYTLVLYLPECLMGVVS